MMAMSLIDQTTEIVVISHHGWMDEWMNGWIDEQNVWINSKCDHYLDSNLENHHRTTSTVRPFRGSHQKAHFEHQ